MDTIVAVATPLGRGGVGIVRFSGPDVLRLAQHFLHTLPEPRYAHFGSFYAADGSILDKGIALRFVAPHSFTGEDVLELHAHGGPVTVQRLIRAGLEWGARLAKPGEFLERAFLAGKMNLLEAEAIADLIEASSEQEAQAALHSMQGRFSKAVEAIARQVLALRVQMEAELDFSDQELETMSIHSWYAAIQAIQSDVEQLLSETRHNLQAHQTFTAVLMGRPNAGKSTVFNALLGEETAIVSDTPGTTRDLLKESLQLQGLTLNLMDTAGLRVSEESIEQEGIRRAIHNLQKASLLLLVVEAAHVDQDLAHLRSLLEPALQQRSSKMKIWLIVNKIDLARPEKEVSQHYEHCFHVCAKTGEGIEALRLALKNCLEAQEVGSTFCARTRHVVALEAVSRHLHSALQQRLPEVVAEELRLAQHELAVLTGQVSVHQLLGEIFNQFCIGK